MGLSLDSPPSRFLARLPLILVVLVVCSQSVADPDLWGHVRFGRDIVASHSVKAADPYSFTSDRPWVNHEWLAEIVMYLVYAAAGSAGLIALKLVLLLAMLAAVSAALSTTSLGVVTSDLLVSIVIVGTVAQTRHIRPQLFSLTLFACLLAVLAAGERKRRWNAFSIVPLMAVWSNLHGGWIVGAGTLAAWSVACLFTDAPFSEKVTVAAASGLGLLATAINPYGWRLWQFLLSTVDLGRPNISEWQPTFAMGWTYILLWSLIASIGAASFGVALVGRSFDLRKYAVVALLAIASFRVNRLLAFFALAATVLAAPELASRWTIAREVRATPHRRRRALVAAVLAIALAGVAFESTMLARNLGCIVMDPTVFPDAGVVRYASDRGVSGRMLTWFDWGEYAIWHLSPKIRVSIDGRRETVYSNDVIDEHVRFYFAPEERQRILDGLRPDYIWIPSELAVTKPLESDGWRAVVAGTHSVLLSRADERQQVVRSEPLEPRCFPGP